MKRILGIKKEMTQLFDEEGKTMPCTIVDVKNVVIVGKKLRAWSTEERSMLY